LPGARDRQFEAWFSGLGGTGLALGMVTRPEGTAPRPLRLERLRERIAARIGATLPGTPGAIAAIVLTGLPQGLPVAVRAEFAAAGLAHLLAVAGLHLGIVMGVALAALRWGLSRFEYPALHWPCKEMATVGALAVGAGYVGLTGLHVPALRALVMAMLVVVALLAGRQPASMRGLALAASGLLLVWPSLVRDLSFQMSFAAVMALIAGYEVLRVPLARLRGEGGHLRAALSHGVALALTSLLAGSATLPVALAHFGTVQPYFVVANMVAVPLMAVWIMPLGLAGWALLPMGWGIRVVLGLARMVAHWAGATLNVPIMPGWGLAVFLIGLCWLCLWRTRWRLAGCGLIALGVMSPGVTARPVAVIASDGGAMLVRTATGYQVTKAAYRDQPVVQAWQSALGRSFRPLDCGAGPCLVPEAGGAIVLRPDDPSDGNVAIDPALCTRAALVLSATPIRASCPGVPAIDRFAVWRDGAFAVWSGR
ncbi:ComEC/Rec2 family competence protein, partial [Ameyamaea chiangmaiensis]